MKDAMTLEEYRESIKKARVKAWRAQARTLRARADIFDALSRGDSLDEYEKSYLILQKEEAKSRSELDFLFNESVVE